MSECCRHDHKPPRKTHLAREQGDCGYHCLKVCTIHDDERTVCGLELEPTERPFGAYGVLSKMYPPIIAAEGDPVTCLRCRRLAFNHPQVKDPQPGEPRLCQNCETQSTYTT